MTFKSIEIYQGWQQFAAVKIDFHPQLTVLTGANGAGKSTLLRFLARHFGYGYTSLLTPGRESNELTWLYRAKKLFRSVLKTGHNEPVRIGAIAYSSGKSSALRAPVEAKAAAYQPTIDSAELIRGFYLPSHRPEFRYERVTTLSLQQKSWEEVAFRAIHGTIVNLSQGQRQQSVSFKMKEVLVSLGIFGYGGGAIQTDYRARELFDGFQDILRNVLPTQLGFDHLEIRDKSEVVLVTTTGEFLLDAVSGGIASLFELTWLIYMYDQQEHKRFSVVIDEPENHLHPEMQRSLLPSLVKAFPRAQFIVATHSPFVVGSVRNSNTYALHFNDEKEVSATKLEFSDTAAGAEDVLRDVLGVGITIPIWAELELESIVRQLAGEELTPASARALRTKIQEAGLSTLLPEAMSRLASIYQK